MADERVQHGLIQKAKRDAEHIGFTIRKGTGRWVVWRLSPTGWVWNSDFADKADAEDYLTGKLCQEER